MPCRHAGRLHVQPCQQMYDLIEQVVIVEQISLQALFQGSVPELEIVDLECLAAFALEVIYPTILQSMSHVKDLTIKSGAEQGGHAWQACGHFDLLIEQKG